MTETSAPVLLVRSNCGPPTPIKAFLETWPGSVVTVATGVDAFSELSSHTYSTIIADYELADMSGIECLRHSKTLQPTAQRILLAERRNLPHVLKQSGHTFIDRVLPRNGFNLDLDGGEDSWQQIAALVKSAASQKHVVLRDFAPDPGHFEIQMVLPRGEGFEKLRHEFLEVFIPLKLRGQKAAFDRRHLVRQTFGGLSQEQELFTLSVAPDVTAYAAFFPWSSEAKVTLLLGAWRESRLVGNEVFDRLREIHAFAEANCREFVLPAPPTDRTTPPPPIWYDKNYAWIITPEYVGPDRRLRDTSFLNKFLFRGKRRVVAEPGSVPSFVDWMDRRTSLMFLGCILLSALDAVLTFAFVRHGNFHEANTFVRGLLRGDARLFIVLKGLVPPAVLFFLFRFHSWRWGRWSLRSITAIYIMLVSYWIWLLK